MAKSEKKRTAVIKRIAAKRLRSRQKRQKTIKASFENKLEKLLGSMDQKEIQSFLMDSSALLNEPELDWVHFAPAEAGRLTKKYYEEHREEFEKPDAAEAGADAHEHEHTHEDGEAHSHEHDHEHDHDHDHEHDHDHDHDDDDDDDDESAPYDRLYADAIGRMTNKPMIYRLKGAIHHIAKRAKEEGKRELMLQAICAEAMFRADIHVSAHPVLIAAFEKARDEGLGDELPDIRGYHLLEARKLAMGVAEADDDDAETDTAGEAAAGETAEAAKDA